MATKQVQAITLSTTARSAIASTYVNALTAFDSTGSLITQVCEKAHQYLRGADMSDEDRNSVTADIAKARGWKGQTAKSRISECNVVLRAYAVLPDAIEAYKAKSKTCQWHNGMAMARRINKGDSIAQAVAFALKRGDSKPTGTPSGRVAGALKAWFKAEPRKREKILEAAGLLGLKLGVKLDA